MTFPPVGFLVPVKMQMSARRRQRPFCPPQDITFSQFKSLEVPPISFLTCSRHLASKTKRDSKCAILAVLKKTREALIESRNKPKPFSSRP